MRDSRIATILSDEERLEANARRARDAMNIVEPEQISIQQPAWLWICAALAVLLAAAAWLTQPAAVRETQDDSGETIYTVSPQYQAPASAGEEAE